MPKRITITISDGQLAGLDEIEARWHNGNKPLSHAGQIRLAIAIAGSATRAALPKADAIQHGGKRKGAGRKSG